ncbi:hypothetical protein [Corallococcus macrosporus]|uniref:Uncharacterized protein n=1 Tax=Myxococcus fulvus (strain ATCC BAA-855 / HW-1) TaxID=483219 RepID=F8CNS4_MYXFH|nr:hypothetical protein [Corallococcus macrosporus]AEI64091.1 hypothetical protein LILAB_10900 [Corallococcus macrosporus]
MRIRYRLILGGAGVLAGALSAVALWPVPVPEPLPVTVLAEPRVAPPPAPPPMARQAVAPLRDEPQVTVARMAPERPEPEVSMPPPQDNDDIEPEAPQTVQWEIEKTARLAALVERDVVRLAREREDALAQGDVQRGEQLDALLQRNLGQLRELHEEIRKRVAVVNGVSPTD